MHKSFRANVKTKVDNTKVREEVRDGRKLIIVPSATLPDDVVMNRIKYPAAAIAKSFKSLERSPAPFGHPTVNGMFVSAKDPEGLARGWIGAWNENVRRENGRVFLDKVIDVKVANQSEEGQKVLAAIAAGEPIHTSTGLYFDATPAEKGQDHDWVINAMTFDHDAILIGTTGAATPEKGVGMMVNSQGESEEIEVVNSSIEDVDDLDRVVEEIARAMQRDKQKPLLAKIKAAIIGVFTGNERETLNNQEVDMTAPTKEQFDALSAEVKTLSETVSGTLANTATTVQEAIAAALKPVTDQIAANAADQKTKDETEAAELVTKVVAANMLAEDVAKVTPLVTLRALAANIKTGAAKPLNHSAAQNNAQGYKLPEGDK
jgi:hypothetical protein